MRDNMLFAGHTKDHLHTAEDLENSLLPGYQLRKQRLEKGLMESPYPIVCEETKQI